VSLSQPPRVGSPRLVLKSKVPSLLLTGRPPRMTLERMLNLDVVGTVCQQTVGLLMRNPLNTPAIASTDRCAGKARPPRLHVSCTDKGVECEEERRV